VERLAAFVYRHRRIVIAAWASALIASLAFTGLIGGTLSNQQELPGSQSIRAGDLLARDFGIPRAEPVQVVFRSPDALTAHRAAIAAIVSRLRTAFPQTPIDSPFDSPSGASGVSRDGRIGYINIPFDDHQKALDGVTPVQRAVGRSLPGGVVVYTAGAPAIQKETNPTLQQDLHRAEFVAGPLTLIVLVLVLGSLVSGAVPLLMAGIVLPTVLAFVYALSHAVDVTIYAPNVVTLIGLGITVDYSLLIVYRFREELARDGDVEGALRRTMRRAGRAVVFSGATVAIGLAALLMVPVPFVRSFGIAGVLIPLVTVGAALTFLPALLAVLGPRLERGRVVPRRLLRADESGVWRRVAAAIMRAPLLFLVAGAVVMLVIASPVRDLKLGNSPLSTLPNTGPAVEGSKLLAATFGGGGVTPVRVWVAAPAATLAHAGRVLRAAPTVTRVEVTPSPRRPGVSLISIYGTGQVGSAAANHLVDDLRSRLLPETIPAGTTWLVGGGPAVFRDFQQSLYGDFGWILLVVLAVTYLFLLRAFRSAVLPAKAVFMNLLSVAGAYGLLVLVFQEGYGAKLFGFETTDQIAVWIPLFLFAFLFGLSMDYEVFLLSRMREEYDLVPDNTHAVSTGLARTGKLITSAALIMVIAFGGLAASRFIEMQEFGFGLAAAILIDATIIRAVIVPSLMKLMGRVNWWLPPLRANRGQG
jgi:RND superfamily putative drug exporter